MATKTTKKVISKSSWFGLYNIELFTFIAWLAFVIMLYFGNQAILAGYLFGSFFITAFLYIQARRGIVIIKNKG